MLLSKLDLVAIAAFAGGILWIEHGHRVKIETPAQIEAWGQAAAACPANESVPFSPDCMSFIQGGVTSDDRSRAPATQSARSSTVPIGDELSGPACPSNNENVPYSESCLRFLSGLSWRANPAENSP